MDDLQKAIKGRVGNSKEELSRRYCVIEAGVLLIDIALKKLKRFKGHNIEERVGYF